MIGNLISSIAGAWSQDQANKTNIKMAKNAIQWRVADAQAAGIHPLAALGANIQPVASQPLLGDAALSGIKGAVDAVAPSEATRLANEETRARIRNQEAQTAETLARTRTIAMGARGPVGSTTGGHSTRVVTDTQPTVRDVHTGPMSFMGWRLPPIGGTSSAQTAQDNYGDWIEWPWGAASFAAAIGAHAYREARRRAGGGVRSLQEGYRRRRFP